MKNTLRKCARLFLITLAILYSYAVAQEHELSVRLELPPELTKGVVPPFAARDGATGNLFQKRQLEKLVAQTAPERVALIYFATWCAPCAKGATMLKAKREELKKNGVLAIFVNVGERNMDEIHEWIGKYGDPELPLVMDMQLSMVKTWGLLEKNGTMIMPKALILDDKLTPLFLLGTEGKDFPEILWRYEP